MTNRPWMVMFLLGVVTLTSFITRGQTTAFYFKYYVGNEALTGVFISSGMIAGIVGIALTGPLTRLFGGKKNLFCVLMAVSGSLTLLFYFIPPNRPWPASSASTPSSPSSRGPTRRWSGRCTPTPPTTASGATAAATPASSSPPPPWPRRGAARWPACSTACC